jgi:hypothetical protein
MEHINWSKPFFLNIATGETSYPFPDPDAGIVTPFPTYGNYGGGHYSEGIAFDGTLLTKPNGSPLGYAQLLAQGTGGQDPVDYLDYLSYRHDVLTSGPVYSPSADIDFINRLILYSSNDAEANLYAGFTELGMIGSLAVHGELDELSPLKLIAAFTDAVKHIEYGLENLPEITVALDLLFESTDDPDVFVFDFSITTDSFGEELLELVAMNAVNQILDGDEADDAFLDTGFPFAGVSDYQLVYTLGTPNDLDLVSA